MKINDLKKRDLRTAMLDLMDDLSSAEFIECLTKILDEEIGSLQETVDKYTEIKQHLNASKDFKSAVKLDRLIEKCVADGALIGYRKAYKHTDDPKEEMIIDCITNNIMVELFSWFELIGEHEIKY